MLARPPHVFTGKLRSRIHGRRQGAGGHQRLPKEIFKTSRRWAETRFKDLRYFNRLDKGGHFAAFERPEAFVQELRACFATMR